MTKSFDTSGLSAEEIFTLKEKQRKEDLRGFAHTAEDCYKNHVFIDGWVDIANFSSTYGEMDFPIYCCVVFNENGEIGTIIVNSVY